MAFTQSIFTMYQGWVQVRVEETGTNYLIPVDHLEIRPTPYSPASGGSTAIMDVFGNHVYRCEGWHHHVTLSYDELPVNYHDQVRDLIAELHHNNGRATIRLAAKDANGVVTVDATRILEVVADFTDEAFAVVFNKRVRSRGLTLNFRGAHVLNEPLNWLSD